MINFNNYRFSCHKCFHCFHRIRSERSCFFHCDRGCFFHHCDRNYERNSTGFTLLEILIALFIFSILSLLLSQGLRSVINTQSHTETAATRLRDLQFALILFERDIEQVVTRPILNAAGKEEAAFSGTSRSISFTQQGVANPQNVARSNMQRIAYHWEQKTLWRTSWPVLDFAPTTKSNARALYNNFSDMRFEFLNAEGRFNKQWPMPENPKEFLPKAIKVTFIIPNWGKLTRIYVISIQPSKVTPPM